MNFSHGERAHGSLIKSATQNQKANLPKKRIESADIPSPSKRDFTCLFLLFSQEQQADLHRIQRNASGMHRV